MSEKTWERNTSGMIAHAHRRKEEKHQRVDEVITRLIRERQAINFNSVAKAAGVSKAYLYSQPDLRARIETLRQQERELAVREHMARPMAGKTDASKDLVILAKDRRIKELEAENRQLKKQLQVALGHAYDRL
jgi:parvulin-like peptidyl-prolyl isomerase